MAQTQCLTIRGVLEDVKLDGVRGTLEDWFQALHAGEASLNPSLSRDYFLKLLKDTQCPFSYLHVKNVTGCVVIFQKIKIFLGEFNPEFYDLRHL